MGEISLYPPYCWKTAITGAECLCLFFFLYLFSLFPLHRFLCSYNFLVFFPFFLSFASPSIHWRYVFSYGLSLSLQGLSLVSTRSLIWSTWRLIHQMEVSVPDTHIHTSKRSNEYRSRKEWIPPGEKKASPGKRRWLALPLNPVHDSWLIWPFFSSLSFAECQLHNAEWQQVLHRRHRWNCLCQPVMPDAFFSYNHSVIDRPRCLFVVSTHDKNKSGATKRDKLVRENVRLHRRVEYNPTHINIPRAPL